MQKNNRLYVIIISLLSTWAAQRACAISTLQMFTLIFFVGSFLLYDRFFRWEQATCAPRSYKITSVIISSLFSVTKTGFLRNMIFSLINTAVFVGIGLYIGSMGIGWYITFAIYILEIIKHLLLIVELCLESIFSRILYKIGRRRKKMT